MAFIQLQPIQLADVKKMYSNSATHCVVVIDKHQKIVFANEALASALGYELSDLINEEFHISTSHTNPLSLITGAVPTTQSHPDQGYIKHKNGKLLLVDFESIEVTDENDEPYIFVRICNLEAYLQLAYHKECKETLQNVLNKLTSAIVVIDQELTVLTTNDLFYTTFDMKKVTGNHVSLQNLVSSFWQNEEVLLRLKSNYQQLQYDFDIECDWERHTGDNKSFKIESRLIHEKNSNTGLEVLLVITDITEEKANQTGRNQQIRHIMHELRNPLSNLALCVELLSDSTKENNQEDTALFLSKAGNSIQRMKQLINDLNEFRAEPGKIL